MDRSENKPLKKSYEPPILVVYGAVHDITQANGPFHHRDGGTSLGMRRTAMVR